MNRPPSAIILVSGIFGIAFLAVAWFFVLPELDSLGMKLRTLSAVEQASSPASSKKGPDAATRQKVAALLPMTDQQYDLSVQIEALCKAEGVIISSLNFNGADPVPVTAASSASSSSSNKVVAVLGVMGSYEAIQRLVTALTALDRFVQVDTVSFALPAAAPTPGAGSAGAVGAGTQMTASIGISAPYLPGTGQASTPTPKPVDPS